ncbi:hypothetical protein QBC39DRAFT_308766 [Podospora conica]|nr:hypothetical protein QBC39DRAFT_308766 [Schizothecium conicum]
MHSPDTARPGARRKPDLMLNTSSPSSSPRHIERDRDRDRDRNRDLDLRDVIPQTPPARHPPVSRAPKSAPGRGEGGRALRLPTARDTADIETFLDSLTPIDMSNRELDRPDLPRPHPDRDSHDLSLSPRQVTRDSLVNNMLLSLDQLSMGNMGNMGGPFGSGSGPRSAYDEFADDSRTMTFTSRTGRGNGHGYSYSSDMEGTDAASGISSRGRRSNSSSGFQSSLGRINSMRETSTHQRSMPGTPKPLHSRGGKGSKSSSTNSIDAGYAQVLSSQRWARGFGGRSSSFDGPEPVRAPAPPQPAAPSPWHIEFSSSFFNDGYDAAPTPTVPGGPRKLATVPSMPVMMPPPEPRQPEPKSPSRASVIERRRSTRSSRSATVGRKADAKLASDVPPVPALNLDSAPAPHVGYEKSKDPVVGTAAPGVQAPKEKPGFFRRMFGASKVAPSPAVSVETTPNRPQFSSQSQSKSPSAPPSRESHQSATHTLQKKTSSFFRRRKPSVTETEPPPIPAVPVVPAAIKPHPADRAAALSVKPEPSPVTSLRRAMDPFLQGGPPISSPLSQGDDILPSTESRLDRGSEATPDRTPRAPSPEPDAAEADRRRTTRGFSPDYEPSPRAVIRAVDPETSDTTDSTKRRTDTPTRPPPDPPKAGPARSFLQDDSDSEDSPKRNRNQLRLPVPESDRKSRSPSPTVSKSKSVPNLGRSRDGAARVASHYEAKLSPVSSHDDRRESANLGLPIEGVLAEGRQSASPAQMSKSAASLPSLRVESAEPSPKGQGTGESINQSSKSIDEPDFVVGDPTEDDRQKAQNIYDGNEDFITKDRAAAWMGEEGIVRQRTLRAYMDLYDFENQSLVNSLRQVCQRLLLRAETQQVDRILVAFVKRWCDCNPNHGFKASDVIHTICYSIILLNTDLHMADIEHKMTRNQFLKNTMTTIRQAVKDAASQGKNLGLDGPARVSEDNDRHLSFRASFMPPPRPGSAFGSYAEPVVDKCGPLVKAPFEGSLRGWESQVEQVLKETYASIRDDRLPFFGAETTPLPTPGGLSVMGMLKRSPSVLSKAPSEGVASTRGRIPNSARESGSRWNSKSRSRPRGFGTGFSSSRTSFDDGQSVWSPTESSATWSRASLGRTHATMSMDSFNSSYPRGDYQQSIGFANALSQAIIREDHAGDSSAPGEDIKNQQLLEDDSLELAGPPWIKEGMVTHKHHLDGVNKKAKDRTWTEMFAVVQKGQLSLFSFSPNKSLRNKNRLRSHGSSNQKGAVVGGGNWQENATTLWTFPLMQTIASGLPSPGYSRSRPHVWALSLPTGAVHLFQVGTHEIGLEFIATANYWAARLSTIPILGGVSNIEYGWSDAIINNALVSAINEGSSSNLPGTGNRPGTSMSSHKGHSRPGSSANVGGIVVGGRASMQSRSSMRSGSFDFPRPGSGSSGVLGGHHHTLPRVGGGGKLPGDRIHIAEWVPPAQSLRPSPVPEKDQLGVLKAYILAIDQELQVHNSLRSPMLLAFTPRGANATRAMANWKRRSEYLLRESVKYSTYVDFLGEAGRRMEEVYRERRGENGGEGGGEGDKEETGQEGGQKEKEGVEGKEREGGEEKEGEKEKKDQEGVEGEKKSEGQEGTTTPAAE